MKISNGLRILLLYNFTVGFGGALYSGLVTPFGRSLGMSPASIGLYFTTFSMISVVCSFAGGLLSQRFGNRKMVIAARVFSIIQLAIFAVTRDFRLFMLAAFARGLVDLQQGSITAITARTAGDKDRATTFGLMSMLQGLSGVIAPVLGGIIADRLGVRFGFLMAIPALLAGLLLAVRFPADEPRAQEQQGQATMTGRAQLAEFLTMLGRPERQVARLIIGFGVLNGAFNGLYGLLLPLIAQDKFGAAYTGISAISTANALGTMATAIIGGRMADKYGKAIVGGALFILGQIPWLFLGSMTGIGQLYAICFLSSVFGNGAGPGFSALAMESVPEKHRSLLMGCFASVFGVAFALVALFTGKVYSVSPGTAVGVLEANVLLSTAFVIYICIIATRSAVRPATDPS